MDIRRQPINRRQRPRDPLERRMDQWFETGRQFVDGVAGNRPGQRRKENSGSFNRSSLDNAGRWMGEKLDWFFDEDDDWVDLSEPEEKSQSTFTQNKKPLGAISLRVPKVISPSVQSDTQETSSDQWPDDSSFRIDRWQRSQPKEDENNQLSSSPFQRQEASSRRPLPRSSRRRH